MLEPKKMLKISLISAAAVLLLIGLGLLIINIKSNQKPEPPTYDNNSAVQLLDKVIETDFNFGYNSYIEEINGYSLDYNGITKWELYKSYFDEFSDLDTTKQMLAVEQFTLYFKTLVNNNILNVNGDYVKLDCDGFTIFTRLQMQYAESKRDNSYVNFLIMNYHIPAENVYTRILVITDNNNKILNIVGEYNAGCVIFYEDKCYGYEIESSSSIYLKYKTSLNNELTLPVKNTEPIDVSEILDNVSLLS